MTSYRFSAAAVAAALVLSACGSKPVAPSENASGKPVNQAPAATAPATTAPQATTQPVQAKVLAAHLDPASLISKERSVFFALDDYSVDAKYLRLMQAHGQYLVANPTLSIRVEGHADERGGTEYNLALGQKRADAVTKLLKSYGVKDKQLEAVSFGKEKPVAAGHDESAWSQNRRVDLSYPSK